MTNNLQKIEELVERIVILYANHSGRESDNRSSFRNDVRELLLSYEKAAEGIINELNRCPECQTVEGHSASCIKCE